MRQQIHKRCFIRCFLAPDPGKDLHLWPGEARPLPRGHMTVVAYLPEPVDRRVELRERTRGRFVAAIAEREGRVHAFGWFARFRAGEERAIQKAGELGELSFR